MKNLKYFLLIVFFAIPAVSVASTVYFSPTSISVRPGQVVNLTVVVDPQGTAYTAKVGVSFPAHLLSVSSFSQASGWLPLTQPGYDSVDNSSGSLIKTGGMAGGVSSPTTFGTITFIAKASGVATISVNSSTQILNAQSQNTFTGGGQSSVNITQPAPTTTTPPATKPVTNPPKTSPVRKLMAPSAETVTTTVVATSTASTTASAEPKELLAQASQAKANSEFLLNIVIPFITFALGFALAQRLKTL